MKWITIILLVICLSQFGYSAEQKHTLKENRQTFVSSNLLELSDKDIQYSPKTVSISRSGKGGGFLFLGIMLNISFVAGLSLMLTVPMFYAFTGAFWLLSMGYLRDDGNKVLKPSPWDNPTITGLFITGIVISLISFPLMIISYVVSARRRKGSRGRRMLTQKKCKIKMDVVSSSLDTVDIGLAVKF